MKPLDIKAKTTSIKPNRIPENESKKNWRLLNKMKAKYGTGDITKYGWKFCKEQKNNDKKLTRFRDSMDKEHGQNHERRGLILT